MIYEVTNPHAPRFIQYVRHSGDVSPEGLTFVAAKDSPSGKSLLVVTHEMSQTVTIFQVADASLLVDSRVIFTPRQPKISQRNITHGNLP